MIFSRDWKRFSCPTFRLIHKIKLDVSEFDNLMHERHGEFEEERGMSTLDLIEAEYGENAKDWVESHI